jgi:hypothetical protein
MAKAVCPKCGNKVKLADYIRAALIRCSRCSHFYHVEDISSGIVSSSVRQDSLSMEDEILKEAMQPGVKRVDDSSATPAAALTSPHFCQHCQMSIPCPTGQTRATVVCAACCNKTSVYAVLHHCPTCDTLLESPTGQQGQETICPGCGHPVTVPQDVLEKELLDPADDTWFGIDCPHCLRDLIAGKEDAGVLAVCPYCFVTLVVPNWGHHLDVAGSGRSHGAVDSLHKSVETRCTKCHNRIPMKIAKCPYCGSEMPG